MLRKIFACLSKKMADYKRSRRGNTATIFALTLVPMTLMVTAAIDINDKHSFKQFSQNACDASILALASSEDLTLWQENNQARTLFRQHMATNKDNYKINALQISRGESEITLRVVLKKKNLFPSIWNPAWVGVSVDCTAARESRGGLEIVFAFDATNSMGFDSRWDDAMDAMDEALEALKSRSARGEFYVGLVPFQDRVNVMGDSKNASRNSWLNPGKAQQIYGDPFRKAWPKNWDGCYEPREEKDGKFDYFMSADYPKTGSDKFMPSIPDVTGGLASRGGGYPKCPDSPIEGPTEDVGNIIDALDDIDRDGTGRFDEGLAWAWRMLSPDWSGKWGESGYPAEYGERTKVAVLVTDGNSNAPKYEACDTWRPTYDKKGYIDGWGGKECDKWGWNQGNPEFFDNMVNICNKMKEDGIFVHIFYLNGNTKAAPHMQSCSSGDGYYHSIDDISDFETALNSISTQVNYARLIQ